MQNNKNTNYVKISDDSEEVAEDGYFAKPKKQRKQKTTEEIIIPSTVTVQVEYKVDDTKKITLGATVPLAKNETLESAHNKLYVKCLESLAKLL